VSRRCAGRLRRLAWLALGVSALAGCSSPAPRHRAPAAPVFFPAAADTPRVQYLTSFASAEDVLPGRGPLGRLVFGERQVSELESVVKPYGVLLDRGRLYVCDTKRNLVAIFDLRHRRFGWLGGPDNGALRKPLNICADARGRRYVADAARAEVVVYDADDVFVGRIGTGELERPVDVAAGDGVLYVCDAKACRIIAFDPEDGRLLRRLGGKGTEPGRFARPTNLALDADGNLLVSDTLNGRIQKLAPDGTPLLVFGEPGDTPGRFARPKGVAVGPDGLIHVVDAAFENVQVFSPGGRILMHFGGPGNGPGQLTLPAQVAIDTEHLDLFRDLVAPGFAPEYLLLVTSQYGPRKVSVYCLGRPREGR